MIIIKGIVFDFDGLIIDTETAWYHCYNSVLSKYNVDLPLEIFWKCIGTHNTILNEFIGERVGKSSITEVKRLAQQLHFETTFNIGLREGVLEYLTEAKELGLKVGLASSSNRDWINRFLCQFDIAHFFDVVKSSDDVRNVKPDPELYFKAIEALEISPNEALAFEDSDNGSRAAKTAGLFCVIVPNPVTEGLTFSSYDLRINTMADQTLSDLLYILEKK